jgi:hypothetical protein
VTCEQLSSSFHDPAGFMFVREGVMYRQVNQSFAEDYEHFQRSGLMDSLARDGLLVPHEPAARSLRASEQAYAVLRPDIVPFISYPYEWSFGQLQDAAILTLELMGRALDRGMVLRDASAFNIQFVGARPILIDGLSFGRYAADRPWEAYRQFCEHFLAPLALMARVDLRLGHLHAEFADGIPLGLASSLLDCRSWVRPGLLVHLHLHAATQRRFAGRVQAAADGRLSLAKLRALVEHLRSTVEGLAANPRPTSWADYEATHSYSVRALESKQELVRSFLRRLRAASVFDCGANTGRFSRVAADVGARVVALDSDVGAVNDHYALLKRTSRDRVLPLVCDVLNPSPAAGWALAERASLVQRGPCDAVLALALLHHLVITNNVPLTHVAAFLPRLGWGAIVEFVPPEDPQVQMLLHRAGGGARHTYSEEGLTKALAPHFATLDRQPIADSQRVLYLLRDRNRAFAR